MGGRRRRRRGKAVGRKGRGDSTVEHKIVEPNRGKKTCRTNGYSMGHG